MKRSFLFIYLFPQPSYFLFFFPITMHYDKPKVLLLFVVCIVYVSSFLYDILIFILIFSSGKTYTMVGTKDDPGLMVLSLHRIFDLIQKDKSSDEFEVTCSYLEVYNEV